MRIGFAFTGAGHLLRESVQLALKLAKDHEVTVFLSGAAEEVLKMYGLYENQDRIRQSGKVFLFEGEFRPNPFFPTRGVLIRVLTVN